MGTANTGSSLLINGLIINRVLSKTGKIARIMNGRQVRPSSEKPKYDAGYKSRVSDEGTIAKIPLGRELNYFNS